MRTRRRATIEDLRRAIDCLPRHTRVAMLEGIAANEIIVGAYATRDGVCPMLAAHRAGGRTSVISFAKAWDRFAFRDARSQRARRATERELLILRTHLEASLLAEDAPVGELAVAHSERAAARSGERVEPRTERAAARSGEPVERGSDLAAARREHLELVARRERERDRESAAERDREQERPAARHDRERPGDPDRGPALRDRPGWAWTRVVRRYDEYERVLGRLEAERAALHGSDEREPALSR